ncbi:STAS domain-containing protein [Bacillus sp. REN3]|uniref:STAS domain-containing protein n=1 Tax=Bacillus sp. REN3 TaxID=2802440 RepID=UPI001AEDC38B|nr:STAS domain-containing protein [Bacillus sp. REN3]
MFNFDTVNTVHLLDKIQENIFIADNKANIVFINECAKELLTKIGPYVGIDSPEGFIGRNLDLFAEKQQQRRIAEGPFPKTVNATLFNTFSAEVTVDRLTDMDNAPNGYILTWKDVTEFEEILLESKKQIQVLDMPAIPLSVDTAFLVPVMGKLTAERLSLMEEKVLAHCAAKQNEYVIFDFTGVSEELDAACTSKLQETINALKLMGTNSIFVGIRPEMAKSMVLDGLRINVPTFNTFVHGIRHIWKETGYQLIKL